MLIEQRKPHEIPTPTEERRKVRSLLIAVDLLWKYHTNPNIRERRSYTQLLAREIRQHASELMTENPFYREENHEDDEN